jgi:protease-4
MIILGDQTQYYLSYTPPYKVSTADGAGENIDYVMPLGAQPSTDDAGTFVGRVAEGRKMAPEAVNAIGEGRVWSGVDAQRIGLVNEFGGLRRAVEIAAERAELGDDWRLVEILEEESELSALLNSLFMARAPRLSGQMGTAAKELEQISREIENGSSVMARMPYHITIY